MSSSFVSSLDNRHERRRSCVTLAEAAADTPVPPLAGYNKDRGGCDIKVRYQRVTDGGEVAPEEPGSANGRYPELAGEWRPTRQGQWTRPHQARDRRTVERWDADGRCQYQTEHDIGVIVVISKEGDEGKEADSQILSRNMSLQLQHFL